MKGENQRDRWLSIRFALIGIIVLLCLLSSRVQAEETTKIESVKRTVRIAFPSQGGMSGVGGSGDLIGYNYEYLQEIAEYAGWKLEYITFDNLSANEGIMNAMNMVMSGEADLLGPMLKSDAVEEMFDFPKDNYGVVYTTLCSLEKSDITSVNYSEISPLRVALYTAADTRNQEVKDYLEQLGINYKLIFCDTSDEQLSLLQEGKADVLSSITLSYFDGTRSVAEFAPRPYYFVTTKGNTELLSELDSATAALNYTKPYLQKQLQEKYFGDTSSGYVLTDNEQKCLERMHSLNILCARESDAPYVCKNEQGKPSGMLISLLNDFAKENNIKISYTFCTSSTEIDNKWQTGQYDCLIGSPLSSKYFMDYGLIRTEAITTVKLVLFAKPQTSKAKEESTIAIYSSLAEQINLENYDKVLQFDDPQKCYEAVENGEADYGCSDRLLTEYTLFERKSDLVTIPLLAEEDICIGVSKTMGNEFLSALNKYIHTLPDSTKTTYLAEGSRHLTKSGIKSLVYDHPITTALIVSIVVILFISSLLLAFFASKNQKRNLELEKANSAKSEFLARISHDIRTPMNAITGYLSIAKDTEGCPEKVEHCLNNSEIAAKHLLQLINDVLDMSSIENGKMKIAKEEFDLKSVILDVTTIFYQTSKKKGVRFETEIIGLTQEKVIGDQLRINQIMMNLLSNAVKFTAEGGLVKLNVEQVDTDENGTNIKFIVSDSGIGMSEEYRTRLFQPFEQESANTARQYGGSGLGLSIVHSLVTLMGGTIEVESVQNKGTTFTVNLHVEKSMQNSYVPLEKMKEMKMRVLFVSGNQKNSENIQTMFASIGVKADSVTSASYAVKRIYRRMTSDYPYKMCIIDWNNLEVINPTQIIHEIKMKMGEDKILLIGAGYDIIEFEEEAKDAGIDSCISMPLFQSTLIELVDAVIDGVDVLKIRKKNKPQIDLSGKRLILAEDNAMNMEIAVTVLSKSKVIIDQAENGKRAVELFKTAKAGTYDFILMDVQMPEMNGYEATEAIRKLNHPDAKKIPIIAMTANAFAQDVSVAAAHGMNAHIAKPVNYNKLFVVLKELLK